MNRAFFLRALCCVVIIVIAKLPRAEAADIQGQVRHGDAPLAGVAVRAISAGGAVLVHTVSDETGTFDLTGLPDPPLTLLFTAAGFTPNRVVIDRDTGAETPLVVDLKFSPILSEVTVTVSRASAEELATTSALAVVRSRADLESRPLATLGNVLSETPAMIQQSTTAQASPFLRGLTGYQVLNIIDGVRFNNSTFRSGPNQYLAFVDPSQADAVEMTLGPASAEYGSDSLGGTIQVLTPSPRFSSSGGLNMHGEVDVSAASADLSGAAAARLFVSGRTLAWMGAASMRKHNDLRAGGGADSHNVLHRFFGLGEDAVNEIIGSRLQDTGFRQGGVSTKLAFRPDGAQSFTFWYQGGRQNGVRGYKDLLGGRGRLQSRFDPQQLHFLYGRYEKVSTGWLDSLSVSASLNVQRDGATTQNELFTNPITTDRSRSRVAGVAVQGITSSGPRHALAFGSEMYWERVDASRVVADPVSGTQRVLRPLYPPGSRYDTLGFFAQESLEIAPRLRLAAGARYTRVHFGSDADAQLGVAAASEDFDDVTFSTALSWRPAGPLGVHARVGKGFRAPNLNDLGALGLNDLGYEIPASQAAPAGAFIGQTAGANSTSTGKNVKALRPETLMNYEVGFTFQTRPVYARLQIFDAELRNPIVRRTLLFPADRVPPSLAGLAINALPQTPEQRAENVVTVATPLDSQAVKAFVNDGASRYYGVEALGEVRLTSTLALETGYSFINGRELDPNRAARRLPPQQGSLGFRYAPGGRRPWLQIVGQFAGPQRRLSGGDIDDERIGASRSRADIARFFTAAVLTPWRSGNVFIPTGETLAQIQNRVLPIGAVIHGVLVRDDNTRVPLFPATPGWFTVHLRGGWHVAESTKFNFAVENLLDRNYRIHGSGADAPGLNVYLGLKYSF